MSVWTHTSTLDEDGVPARLGFAVGVELLPLGMAV